MPKNPYYAPGAYQSNAPRQRFQPSAALLQEITNKVNQYITAKNIAGTPIAQQLINGIPVLANYYTVPELLTNDMLNNITRSLQTNRFSEPGMGIPEHWRRSNKAAFEISKAFGPLPVVAQPAPGISQRKQTSNWQPSSGLDVLNEASGNAQPQSIPPSNQPLLNYEEIIDIGNKAKNAEQPQAKPTAGAPKKSFTQGAQPSTQPQAAPLLDYDDIMAIGNKAKNAQQQQAKPAAAAPVQPNIPAAPEQNYLAQLTPEQQAQVRKEAALIYRENPRRPNETLEQYTSRLKPLMDEAAGVIRSFKTQPTPAQRIKDAIAIIEAAEKSKKPLSPSQQSQLNNLVNEAEDLLRDNPSLATTLKGDIALIKKYANQPVAKEQPATGKEGKQEVNPPVTQPATNAPAAAQPLLDYDEIMAIGNKYKNAQQPQAETTPEETEPIETTPPSETPPTATAQQNERGNFLLDRMNALLGQIRRTGRRATPTELTQVRDLYGDMNTAFGGNIPANLMPQVNRIKRDFNSQANLLNVRRIDEVAPNRNLAQSLGVPLDAQGNPNLNDYAAQFPQFFNNAERPALLNESQIKKEDLPLFKKIRSDINAVNWANNIGEQGYDLERDKKGNLKYPNRKDQIEHRKREDAAYRASDAYKTTQLPAGLVTQQAAAQQPAVPSYFDEDLPFQAGPVNAAAIQQPQATQPAAQGGTIPGPTYNVAATTGQPIAPATGEPIQQQTVGERKGKVGQLFLGGNSQLLQIPQYTPWQREMIRELGTMGMESLRQAYQPLDAPERQQAAAQNAMNLILERLQNNDPQGAQQELILAGGLGNLQAAINGMPSQPIGQGIQQPVAQPAQQQPMDERNQRILIDRLNNLRGQGMEPRAWNQLNPDEKNQATQIAQQLSRISNPIPQVQPALAQLGQLYPQAIQPPAQPQTFDNRPAAGVLPRVRQGLAQTAQGVQGAEQMQGGVGNIRNAAQGFGPGFKQAWAQPGITPALDFLTQRGGQFARGVGELFGGAADVVRSGANIANLAQGRPMQPGAPVPPGTPGAGGAPVPPQGGLGALGLLNRGQGYNYPMPYTAANEMQRFYEDTVPTLAERFTAAGGGQRSAAFQGALGRAGTSMGLGLGALGEQQQLAQQQQAFNQQQTQREFDALQRQRQQQLQRQDQLFAFNRGTALLNPALNQLTSQAILPGSAGILPGIINATGQAVGAGVKMGSNFL